METTKEEYLEKWENIGYKKALSSSDYKEIMRKRQNIYEMILDCSCTGKKKFIRELIDQLGELENERAGLEMLAMLDVAYEDFSKK